MVNDSLSIKREQNVRIVSPRSMTVVNVFYCGVVLDLK
jgi:hypothetical protein